jgi:alpha-N-arabinofuranosidase
MQVRVTTHRDFTIAAIDERLFGAFLEHLGRAVYTGIYEPGHPTADGDGFRGDVLALVRELAPPVVRYPGGNFVSAYNWEDGVGPRETRPARLDLAWRTTERNQIGINEFVDWCRLAGTAPMIAVNLGSRGLDAARALLEYCNHPGGTRWSDLRVEHGWAATHDVRLWCLGNEMDGPWQVGHKTATEYGRLANETAKAMKAFDPSLELVVCGSSHAQMPTYPAWEAEVLEQCYDAVDHISLHMYVRNDDKDTPRYLAQSLLMERYIETVGGVIDYVQARKRSAKKITICFDEWNVWYHTREADKERMAAWDWPEHPRLLEDNYDFADVLVVACILNTLIRQSHRVRIACIAQLVNVIAPIMAEPGGTAWRQTIFHPFHLASVHGRGTALRCVVDAPAYDVTETGPEGSEEVVVGDVPYLDVSAVHDERAGRVTFFLVNRHGTETLSAELGLGGFSPRAIAERVVMAGHGLDETNTVSNPDRVRPTGDLEASLDGDRVRAVLPPLSYAMVGVSV